MPYGAYPWTVSAIIVIEYLPLVCDYFSSVLIIQFIHHCCKITIFLSSVVTYCCLYNFGTYCCQANLELKYRAGSYHQCGGAIISSHHILTAAHCLDGYKAEEFRVKVGDDSRSKLDEHEQSFDVESWKIHPKFQVGKFIRELSLELITKSAKVLYSL